MEVVKFLKEHGIEKLKEEFAIRVKEYPDVYILNYDQIDSPKTHQITRECRSLVLDKNFDVVSRSFDRFFNHGEGGECEVDFNNALALEKVDGSLIGLSKYPDGRWYFRTRGTAYAEAEMPNGEVYRDAILSCIGVRSMDDLQTRMMHVEEHFTFIFEFVSPSNRIVTRYESPELVLLAVRRNNGHYDHLMNGEHLGNIVDELTRLTLFNNIRACKMFPVNTVDDVNSLVSNLGDLQEGFVVLDTFLHTRVKIKSLAYLKVHKIRGENGAPSINDVAELIVENEHEEFLTYFGEYKPMFDEVESVWVQLIAGAERLYNDTRAIDGQKDFALAVKDHPLSGVLFTSRAKKMEVHQAVTEAKTTMKTKILVQEYNKEKNAK